MSLLRNTNIAISAIMFLGLGRCAAEDNVLLRGQTTDLAASNLKGTTSDAADTVQVFHGRILACLFPCLRGPYYGGCYGGSGGCYGGSGGCYGSSGGFYGSSGGYYGSGYGSGYGGSGVGYSMAGTPYQGFATPAPAYAAPSVARAYPVPSATYYPAPNAAYYAPEPARAVVTLPRLGLTFSIGSGNGLLASRSTLGNSLVPRTEEPRTAPSVDLQPEQYRYDGGPATPIPMPKGNTQSSPSVDPSAAPALNNRTKVALANAAPAKASWLAYGDRPKQMPAAAGNLLVKEGHR